MQWHSFTSLELSVPDIPSAEEETRDFMQIIKIFLPKKKSPTPNQAEMFSQPTERISDRQRLRIQSDETGKPVWKEEEYRDINVWTWLQDIPVWCKGALSKHWPTLLQIKQDCLISMLLLQNYTDQLKLWNYSSRQSTLPTVLLPGHELTALHREKQLPDWRSPHTAACCGDMNMHRNIKASSLVKSHWTSFPLLKTLIS